MVRESEDREISEFRHRVWIVAGVAVAVLALLAMFWFGLSILLMVFVGLLLALFFSLPANWLCRHTFLSRRWALLVVLLALIGILAAFGLNFAFSISQQFAQLAEVLPGSLEGLEDWVASWPLGAQLIERIEQSSAPQGIFGNWSTRVSTVFSTTLGALLNLVVIVFIGLFIAIEPTIYKAGLLQLVAPAQRDNAADLLQIIQRKLAWWLVGRLASMSAVGLLAGTGLWLLGIPMALSLGLLAALLSFIPYLGPLMSVVPALLVAFSHDPASMVHVGLLYVGLQTLESYVVTPLIQREAVSIPPALLLVVQVWLGLIAGLMGVLVAEPLIVISMVLVQRLYVKGWLEKGKSPPAEAEPTTSSESRQEDA